MPEPLNRATRTTPPPKKAGAWAAVHKLITALMGRVAAIEARGPIAGKDGIGLTDALIGAEGNLVLTLSNGDVKRLGRVVGEDGITPTFEPPTIENPKDGNDGVGIKEATLNAEGHLVLILTDGSPLDVGRVKGEDGEDGVSPTPPRAPKNGNDGIGISSAMQNADGELLLVLTNGTPLNVGRVRGLDGVSPPTVEDGNDGRGIVGAFIDAEGHLVVSYSDGQTQDIGRVVGKDGASPDKPENGADGVGIGSALIDQAGALILTLTDGKALDLGRVVGRDGVSPDPLPPLPARHGNDGVGIAGAHIDAEGGLVLALTNGADMQVGRVRGQDGISPDKPENGKDGVSVIGAYLEDDVLKMELTGGARVVVGKIEPRKGDKGDAGVGIDAAELVNGELVLGFTDGRKQNVGKLPVAKAPKPPKIDVPEISVSEPYAHNLTEADLEFLSFRDLTINGVTFQVLGRG